MGCPKQVAWKIKSYKKYWQSMYSVPHHAQQGCGGMIKTQFALVLDYFGVEYELKEEANYLLGALNTHYEAVAEDQEGNIFCAINLEW